MMSFVSFTFILFLGMTFFTYFISPLRMQWLVLLVFSLLYYYLCSHKLLIVLLAVSLFTYLCARIINQTQDKKKRKIITNCGIAIVLLDLVVFKYSDFLIENINALFHGNISLLKLSLPLGISYFTLQAISYLIDVNKKKAEPEKNYFRFLLYMAYFPQIVQGPIPKYKELSGQLYEGHEFDYKRICHGLQLMLWGIAKKIILADRLGVAVSQIFDHYTDYHGLFVFFGVVCYGFQIYADFSGGIDTIRGISEVFGITLRENFSQPYYAHSVEEFWRRWHISLGAWMREYVFYPLSLSKRLNKTGKRLINVFGKTFGRKFAPFSAMFIVYLLVGIWHGADWKYVVYGLWNGIFIMNGILFEDRFKMMREHFSVNEDTKWFSYFQMFRTFMIVSFGRLISRASSLSAAVGMFKAIFKDLFVFSDFNLETLVSLGLNLREWILCLIAIVIILYIDHLKEKGIKIRENISNKKIAIRWTYYFLLIMVILIFGKYGPGYEAANFIYGKF